MPHILQLLNLPGVNLNITLLSVLLSLLGALYLAYEFLDRPQGGLLRQLLQISLPMLVAIIASIPLALLLFFANLLPFVQNALSWAPIAVIIVAVFIGLFHGLFANSPVSAERILPDQDATKLPSIRKRGRWSWRGMWQGCFFGFFLGFFYFFIVFTIFYLTRQNLIDFINSDSWLFGSEWFANAEFAFAIGLLIGLLGLIWRGRIDKALLSPSAKSKQGHPSPWKWNRILQPFHRFYCFFFRDTFKVMDDGLSEGRQTETASDEYAPSKPILPQSSPVSLTHTSFSPKEGRTAFRFWLTIALLAVLVSILQLFSPSYRTPSGVIEVLSTDLVIILMLVLPGWIAGGFSSYAHWTTHRKLEQGGKKMLGYTGVIITLIGFTLQVIGPVVQQLQPPSGFTGPISVISWSPDGRRIAVTGGTGSQRIQVIDAATGTRIAMNYSRLNSVRNMLWSNDGSQIASWDDSGDIQVWNANTGSNVALFGQIDAFEIFPPDSLPVLTWSPAGTHYLAVAQSYLDTFDGTGSAVHVLDTRTGQVVSTLRCSQSDAHHVTDLAWSPDGLYLASAYNNGTTCIWNPQNDHLLATWKVPSDSLAWSSTNQLNNDPSFTVISRRIGDSSYYLLAYSYASSTLPSGIPLSAGYISAWSDDRTYLAIARENLVDIWNTKSDRHLLMYDGHFSAITTIAWSPHGTYIATGDTNQIVEIWDGVTGSHFVTYYSTD